MKIITSFLTLCRVRNSGTNKTIFGKKHYWFIILTILLYFLLNKTKRDYDDNNSYDNENNTV